MKTFLKIIIILTALLILCVASVTHSEYFEKLVSLNLVNTNSDQKIEKGLPIHLKIPIVNVDANIESLGMTEGGAMDVPSGREDVAWFNLGSKPGDEGSAVIAGHYGWKDNQEAVFDNLDKLKKGDLVSVENDQGKIIFFVVKESKLYDAGETVPEVFTSYSGVHLNLITCAGKWNVLEKDHPKRLVVFTDLVIN